MSSERRGTVPKETFFNLPESKRRLVEKTAISEFTEYGYDKASITRIVNKCKIAKGSFYQYFNDKKDLYLYLFNRIGEKKVKALAPVIQNRDQYDFFTFIRELFLEGIKFAAANPEFTLMGEWLYKNKNHPIYNELIKQGMENAQGMYTDFLKSAISKGEIRDNIDLKFISHAVSSLSVSTMEYYFQDRIGKKGGILNFDEGMMDTIDLLIDLLRYGIGTQRKEGNGND